MEKENLDEEFVRWRNPAGRVALEEKTGRGKAGSGEEIELGEKAGEFGDAACKRRWENSDILSISKFWRRK